jgi:hypothetical protein
MRPASRFACPGGSRLRRSDYSTFSPETYDCAQAPEWLRKAVKGGTRWVDSMAVILEKLDAPSRG